MKLSIISICCAIIALSGLFATASESNLPDVCAEKLLPDLDPLIASSYMSAITEQMDPTKPLGYAVLDTRSWLGNFDWKQILTKLKIAGSEALPGKRPKILQFDYFKNTENEWELKGGSSVARAPELAEKALFEYAAQIENLLKGSGIDGLDLRVLDARFRVENMKGGSWSLRDLFTNLLHLDGPHMNITTAVIGSGTRVQVEGKEFYVRELDTLINSGILRAQEIPGVIATVHAIPKIPDERLVLVLRVYAFRNGERIKTKPENRGSLGKSLKLIWSLNRPRL